MKSSSILDTGCWTLDFIEYQASSIQYLFKKIRYTFQLNFLQKIKNLATRNILFGIAMDRQLITDLDENIQDYFPGYADVLNQGAKSQITLRHLLSMTAGFEYDEDLNSFFDDRNSHVAMNKSGNPIRYIFESPLQNQPGEKFNYNSGLSITLGEIIKRASSLPADKFAEKYLFAPLGISDYYWAIYPDSTVQTGGGTSNVAP